MKFAAAELYYDTGPEDATVLMDSTEMLYWWRNSITSFEMGAVYFPVPIKSISMHQLDNAMIPIGGLYSVTGFSDSGVILSRDCTSHSRIISLKAITPPL